MPNSVTAIKPNKELYFYDFKNTGYIGLDAWLLTELITFQVAPQ